MTIESLQQLPRNEKLKLLETLWEDLSHPEDALQSPGWHEKVLAETEQRLAEGKEETLDWSAAKKSLRSKFG